MCVYTSAKMSVEHLLKSAAKHCQPTAAQKRAVRERVLATTKAESWLTNVRNWLVPSVQQKAQAQAAVQSALDRDAALLSVRAALTPGAKVKAAIAERINQGVITKANHWLQVNSYRWVAAFTAVALIVGISPKFVVAPQIFADVDVRLMPIHGDVKYCYQADCVALIEDVNVEPGMRIKSGDGEATIVFRDDAVVRLAPFTDVLVNDTQPIGSNAPELLPTFTVNSGKIWGQGLVPRSSRGVTFALPSGFVIVHEGSFFCSG